MDAIEESGPSKSQLLALVKGVRACDFDAVDTAVAFFARESRGHWHNRARAKIARRLKHCALTPSQAACIVDAVISRLTSGRFTEQFDDQLRLALFLDQEKVQHSARQAIASDVQHVRRYAEWVLAHHGPFTRRTLAPEALPQESSGGSDCE
jgi:hypothetical protein